MIWKQLRRKKERKKERRKKNSHLCFNSWGLAAFALAPEKPKKLPSTPAWSRASLKRTAGHRKRRREEEKKRQDVFILVHHKMVHHKWFSHFWGRESRERLKRRKSRSGRREKRDKRERYFFLPSRATGFATAKWSPRVRIRQGSNNGCCPWRPRLDSSLLVARLVRAGRGRDGRSEYRRLRRKERAHERHDVTRNSLLDPIVFAASTFKRKRFVVYYRWKPKKIRFKTLGFWIFRKDMIFPYGNISGNVGEEFLRRKKNAGFGFREVEITYYLLSEFFWVQHINLDVDLLKKNNVIQRIFYCSLCDRSMAFHVDWGPLSQFDVRRRSVVGFHYSSHSG